MPLKHNTSDDAYIVVLEILAIVNVDIENSSNTLVITANHIVPLTWQAKHDLMPSRL